MGNKQGQARAPAGSSVPAGSSSNTQPPSSTQSSPPVQEPVNLRNRTQSPAFADVDKNRVFISTSSYINVRAPGDLSFEAGTLMEIINWDDDPNWFLARNQNGDVGYVPSAFVTHCESLETFPWFHGAVGRMDAEKKLCGRGSGTFMIRESSQNIGDFTVSMIHEDRVYHYRIHKLNHSRFCLGDPNFSFESLSSFVGYHSNNHGGLCSFLELPCPKEAKDAQIYGTSDTRDKWELNKNEIILGTKLGSGQYGDVYRGKWRNMNVAVKQLKGVATDTNWIKEFKMESGIMKKLHHPNLVELLGVCTESQPYYIVTELLEKKSLLDFLRSVEGRTNLDAPALLNMSIQVCSGMVYLEERKYIHRDLAARNCLVAADYTVKVADFGLSRLVDCGDNIYMASEGAKFPIKWTAPEALEYSRFTTCSDVWSFGILLWEISSLGKVPYPDTELGDVINRIRAGYRLPCPANCPTNVYNVMLTCWAYDPNERPTFTKLRNELLQIQEKMEVDVSVVDMIQGNIQHPHPPQPMPKSMASPGPGRSRPRQTREMWVNTCAQTISAIHRVAKSKGSKDANSNLTFHANGMLRAALAVVEDYGWNVDRGSQNDCNEVIVYLSTHIAFAEKGLDMWTTHERATAIDAYFRVVKDTEDTLCRLLKWES